MAIVKEIDIVVKTDEAVKSVDKLNDGIKKVDKTSEQLEAQNKETAKSAKGVGTAVKGIGTALKAIGIGLIIALFAKLGDALSKNQKVADFFTNAMTSLSIVFNDLFTLIEENFSVITDIFENPLESLKKLGNLIKENIIERFKSALEVAGFLGKGLKQLFEGDFSGALDTAKEAGKELIDVFTGVDDTLGKAGGLIDKSKEYLATTYEQAKATTELANSSRLAEAQQRRIFEQYDRDAEIQRRIRDDFELTAQQRLDANQKLKEILDEQEKIQLNLGRISVASANAQIQATGNNIENQEALINALGELDAIEADIAGRRAEQEAQDRALRKEILDSRKEEIGEVINIDNLRVENKALSLEEEIRLTYEARLRENQINKESADYQMMLDSMVKDAKVGIAMDTLALIGSIAEEGSAVAKGVAVAQATINGFQAVQNSFATASASPITTVFPAYPFIQAGLAGAFTAIQIRDILKTDPSGKSVPSSGGGGRGGGGGGQSAPSFNVVGANPVNQLADTLNQQQEPIEAYVVAGNVSSAQEANRNIVETATIG